MNSTRVFGLFAIALLGLSTLSGCSGQNSEAGPPIPDPDPKSLPANPAGTQQTDAMKNAAAAQAAAQQQKR